jgi:hypothetical protein
MSMKCKLSNPLSLVLLALLVSPVFAQTPIYRCGNEYTNTVPDSQKSRCKLIEGGNVTVVEGFKLPAPAASSPKPSAAKPTASSPTPAGARVDSAEQRARDSDARLILEAELKKAQARQAELLREYNGGQPDKQGDEARNYQKYLDRVADLKANLARTDSDVAGIQRELARLPGSK